MPLLDGDDEETIRKNVAELISSGYDPDQAVAIAHSHAKKTRADASIAATVVRHLVRLKKASGLRGLRRRRLPKQIYPFAIERTYAERIIALAVGPMRRAMAEARGELAAILESAKLERGDELDHRRFAGLRVAVENPKGTVRRWVDQDGAVRGETLMKCDYGYVDDTRGADGDPVDVYLGPDEEAPHVHVVHQLRAPDFRQYDEDKVMLGFPDHDAAVEMYLAHRDDPRALGGVTTMTRELFLKSIGATDGSPLTFKTDADETRRARDLMSKVKKRLGDLTHPGDVEELGRKFAKQTSTFQRVQLSRQVKAALGVDVAPKDSKLHGQIESFAHENASLITSMQGKAISKIEGMVIRAVTSGKLVDDLADDIEEEFDVGESHAKLIARDQIGKLYGQINASRQKDLGVSRFIWRTVGDGRVRPEHDELEKASEKDPFTYDDPPDGELPGEPIQCRCHAEPVFEDMLNEE